MRFYGLTLFASAIVLGACGGGADTSATTDEAAPAAAPAADAPAAAPAGDAAAAPITGTIHEVKMLGDAQGYRFEPADITVKQGDGIKYVFVSGGPHNVAFLNIPEAVKAQLNANIPERMGDLSSKMMLTEGEEVTVSFGNIPAGTYEFDCTPHAAMNMKGTVTVE